jgi:predicted  nucleic acid-binding Zn-ribbon protein
MRRAAADLKTSEQAQTDAVHNEDFEQADQMNAVLDRLKAELATSTRDLVGVRASLEATMNRRAAATSKTKIMLDAAITKFSELRASQEREMNIFVSGETSRIEKQEDQLNSDFDRVDRTIVHVDLDLSEVKKEEEGVETAIQTETKDVAAEKATLVELEAKLDAEMEELKRQVTLSFANVKITCMLIVSISMNMEWL